jgi:hypothetical protein
MAKPSIVLSGFSATLWMQTASGSPLSPAQLQTQASVSPIASTTSGTLIPVEAIPAFGQDDAVATYSLAGYRQGDKIPVQSSPTSMTLTCPWNPNDAALALLQADTLPSPSNTTASAGQVERTYVVKATDGTNSIFYAFNARVGGFQIDSQPSAEAKCIVTLHPRGNQYGWSNT